MTVWFAFQVLQQHTPTPDDIICVCQKKETLVSMLRNRAESRALVMSTTDNPAFQYEFRRTDNTIHSYVAVKELPVF